MSINVASASSATVVVAVDVGKNTVALSVTDAERRRLFGPVDFAMTSPGLASVVERVRGALPDQAVVKGRGRGRRSLSPAARGPLGVASWLAGP